MTPVLFDCFTCFFYVAVVQWTTNKVEYIRTMGKWLHQLLYSRQQPELARQTSLIKRLNNRDRAFQWNSQGQRKRDRPKNTWRRGVEQEMKEAGVTWGSLEPTAQDRVKWKRFVCVHCSTSGADKGLSQVSKVSHQFCRCCAVASELRAECSRTRECRT